MVGTVTRNDLAFAGDQRAIFTAASLASVPEVAKKNFSSPLGSTSSKNWLNSARTSVAWTGGYIRQRPRLSLNRPNDRLVVVAQVDAD